MGSELMSGPGLFDCEIFVARFVRFHIVEVDRFDIGVNGIEFYSFLCPVGNEK